MITIFLAEDDLDDQELLAEAFSEINPSIRLISFSSGKTLLEHLNQLSDTEIPQLIVLDYNIPELNGADILKILEENSRFHPVIQLALFTNYFPGNG